MTKVAQRSFMAEFEILLARTWESQSNTLSDHYVQKTRDAIAHIREFYTFKMRRVDRRNLTTSPPQIST